jgi:hypothetical protein
MMWRHWVVWNTPEAHPHAACPHPLSSVIATYTKAPRVMKTMHFLPSPPSIQRSGIIPTLLKPHPQEAVSEVQVGVLRAWAVGPGGDSSDKC